MMFQKIGICMTTGVLLTSLAIPAKAAQTGTIQVSIDSGLTDVSNRRLMLYRVGEAAAEGYQITEEFGGGLVLDSDAFSPHLARMLAETNGSSGSFQLVDVENSAVFSSVEPGLYLLMEDGEEPMILPCMTAIPQGDSWQVNAYPAVRYYAEQNPRTGQHPGPILGAIGMVMSSIGLAVCAGIKRKK